MAFTFTEQVKQILRASGFTEAEIRTQEVRTAQGMNQSKRPDGAEPGIELPERFTGKPEDLPKVFQN